MFPYPTIPQEEREEQYEQDPHPGAVHGAVHQRAMQRFMDVSVWVTAPHRTVLHPTLSYRTVPSYIIPITLTALP